jgi:ATP-dependent helicase/nuclease subunit A
MHELLWYMLDRTGYGDYAAAMPGGEQRKANLDMLAEKAMAYESTSYRGLFNFVRYIEQLQKYEVDYGEANILGEGEDTVRMMSIHKSKGLEFPIVFVAGMNKTFNQQDTRSRLALHPDYGIGCDWVDPEMRIKAPTLLKRMIQRQQANENLGEELRVLYVALTRAKEKLILTGAVKLDTKEKKWIGSAQVADQTLSFGSLTGAASYLDWIMPVLKRYGEREAGYRVEIFTPGDLAIQEATGQLESHWTRDMLLAWDTEKVYDEAERERIEKLFDWDYPWKDCMDIYGKITVSELKHMHQTQDLEETYECFPEEQQEKASAKEPDLVPVIPSFIQEKQEVKGAARGTVYHRLLEHLDYERSKDDAGIRQQVQELVQEGRMTEKEAGVIRVSDILQFRKSSLGERMAAAAARQELFREQPFVLGVPADEIRDTWEGEDLVLVQGIIDAWFLEGDDIVLVDYKTDHVEKGQEQRLIDRYGIQLATYARALERLTDRKVKEQYIYSFRLQRALENKVVE